MRRLGAAVVTAVLAAGVLTGCSSSGKAAPSTPGSGGSAGSGGSVGTTTVDVKNFAFAPSTLTVNRGATVTWRFDDSAKHNVTATSGGFTSTDLSSGGTYSHTFNTPGTYDYICSIHQFMKATITVK